MFGDILDRIKRNFRLSKHRVKKVFFSKGLVNGLGQKFAMFSIFILGKIEQEYVMEDILDRKNRSRL